jgi:hypothetical protein
VNVSPNFPVVAETFLRMYEETRGEALDGVVAMDPVALAALMEATGPLTVEGSDIEVTSDNVEEFLLRDSYLEFADPEAQNEYLGQLVTAFWRKVRDGDFDAATLASRLADSVATQHFKVYARDPDDRSAMVEADADGDYEVPDGNVQMVFNNNYSANKVDYYLSKHVEMRVVLDADGDANIATTTRLMNDAPTGPPSLLLGPNPTYHPDDPPGMNRMLINVLLPRGADTEAWTSGGTTREPFVYDDEKHPVAWDSLALEAGAELDAKLTYQVPEMADLASDGGRFHMTLFPQATVNPHAFSFTLVAPHGFLVREAGSGDVGGDTFTLSGELTEPVDIDLELVPR